MSRLILKLFLLDRSCLKTHGSSMKNRKNRNTISIKAKSLYQLCLNFGLFQEGKIREVLNTVRINSLSLFVLKKHGFRLMNNLPDRFTIGERKLMLMESLVSGSLLFFLIVMGTGALAQWNEIHESKNLDQLLRAEAKIILSWELEKNCQLEKKNQWFPENCLKLWNHHLLEINRQVPREEYKQLNKLCHEKVEEITDGEFLRIFLADWAIPGDCRRTLKSRYKDIQYMEKRNFGPNIEPNPKNGKNDNQ